MSEREVPASQELTITLLGTGSSGGVPRGDGDWGACDPDESKNARTRCSMLVTRSGQEGETHVLVDTSPDLRRQALANNFKHIDGVLYTHDHADQTHGIDDLRVFAMRRRRRIQTWMDPVTAQQLTSRFHYIFEPVENYPAILEARNLPEHGTPFQIDGDGGAIPIVTFNQAHGPIRCVGYRFGDISYSSDVSGLDDTALDQVRGSKLWIVDALRWTPHPTHAHVDRALDWIARAKVQSAVLTNLHIDLDYKTLSALVPAHVEVGYDGWGHKVPF